MSKKDILHRFIFDQAPVRGELVQLDQAWQAIISRHNYPECVRDVLGQSMAATVLLSATIKFLGSITLQIQGDGPVSMLVVQVNTDKKVRAMASYEGDDLKPGLKQMFGQARLMITIEMDNAAERYQGIVELGEKDIATALEEYFRQSEQLKTRLWLAADDKMAAGFLLQEMPKESMPDADKDAWGRFTTLADTLKHEELYHLDAKEILHRLYHEENVRLFSPEQIEFACSCTQEKIEKTLRTMGMAEVQDIIAEQGHVEVACNFCNQLYEFDAIDVEKLFTKSFTMETSNTRH